MLFDYRSFIKNGYLCAVGKMADYQIMLNAAGYYDKGVLVSDDLVEIQAAIEEKNAKLAAEEQARLEAERIAAEETGELAEQIEETV